MTGGYTITSLTADAYGAALDDLGALLVDTVDGGASVGFLAPLDPAAARAWWASREDDLAAGRHAMWVARRSDGTVVGTVQVHPGAMPNGRHRGEVVKLMVHQEARGAGLGRRLLAAAEDGARDLGLSVLVLDTETGSPAEKLYASSGWTQCGVIPDYARDAHGELRPTTLFAKRLDGVEFGAGG